MSQPERTKRYKEKRKRPGLCLTCSRKATQGLLRCRVCRAKSREIRMARYPLFCPECRKLIKPEERHGGKSFHKLCAQKRKARREPPTHRRAALAYQRRHRELGLCRSCSEKAFKWGFCRKHYTIGLERHYDRAASRRISLQQPSVTKVKARSI